MSYAENPHHFVISLAVQGFFQNSVGVYVQYSKEGTSLKSEICGRKTGLGTPVRI